jgi:hypothetical protein
MKKKHMIAIVTTILLLPSGAFAVTNDMTNYWTLDEGTGRSVNDSIGGQNGVMLGESKGFGWASGKVGTAIGIDGAEGDAIVLPDQFIKGSQGTLALWFKMNSLTDRNVIFSARSTIDNNVYAMLAVDRDGRLTLYKRDAASSNETVVQSTKILNVNEWYNVVFTANTQSYHVYINGEDTLLAGDNTGRWFPDMTNHNLMYRFAAITSSSRNGVLDGYLDDLRLYSRPLTLDEAKALYDETNAAKPTIPTMIAPTINLTISQDSIPYGGSVALRWNTSNVTSCTKSGSWSGVASTTGEEVIVRIGSDSTYTLDCGGGKGGSTIATVTVHVSPTATSTLATTVSGGTLTVSGVIPTRADGTIDPRGLTREQLISAIKAKIAELQALLKSMSGNQ